MTTETTESAAVICHVCGREITERQLEQFAYMTAARGRKIHRHCEGAYYRGVSAS